MRLSKLAAPVMLIASSLACASAGSGPRTEPLDSQSGKVEIRIKNHNWSTAKVYIASRGTRPYRIATVNGGRTEVKHVRIYSTRFFFVVTLLADKETWSGFTEWDSDEECMHLTIENALYLSNAVPCFARQQ